MCDHVVQKSAVRSSRFSFAKNKKKTGFANAEDGCEQCLCFPFSRADASARSMFLFFGHTKPDFCVGPATATRSAKTDPVKEVFSSREIRNCEEKEERKPLC